MYLDVHNSAKTKRTCSELGFFYYSVNSENIIGSYRVSFTGKIENRVPLKETKKKQIHTKVQIENSSLKRNRFSV